MLRVSLVILSTLAALLLAEAGLHLLRPKVDYAYAPQSIDVSHFRPSSYLPHELRQNNRSRFRMAEFDTTVITNSLGLRDDEVDGSKPRVLCLGDSFTFGFGVENGETFCAGLERAFGGRYDFVNAGFADGNSPDTYALWLTHNLARLSPQALVISFFQNDYSDVRLHTWESADGRELDGTTPPSRIGEPGTVVTPDGALMRDTRIAHWPVFARQLIKESYIIALIRDRVLRDASGPEFVLAPPKPRAAVTPPGAPDPNDRRFNAAVEALLAAAGDTRLIFHLIPVKGQTTDSPVDTLVRTFANQNHIFVVSRYDAFAATDYFEMDGHWNARGHAVAANYLHAVLAEMGF